MDSAKMTSEGVKNTVCPALLTMNFSSSDDWPRFSMKLKGNLSIVALIDILEKLLFIGL